MRHGWFIIPGVQNGDRSLDEQRAGLDLALSQCKGKTVLDLGCAEGLISLEFASAGAAFVKGLDAVAGHIEVARSLAADVYSNVSFEVEDLNQADLAPAYRRYDIVLALGVAHKMHKPEVVVRYAARCSRDMVVIRTPRHSIGGLLRSKFIADAQCDTQAVMSTEGFELTESFAGPRGEKVHYYRARPHYASIS